MYFIEHRLSTNQQKDPHLLTFYPVQCMQITPNMNKGRGIKKVDHITKIDVAVHVFRASQVMAVALHFHVDISRKFPVMHARRLDFG